MIIGVDIRPLMEKYYSGVSEYLFNLLDAIFKLEMAKPEKERNHYKLFYNSFKKIKSPLPQWNYSNVEIISTRWPNKIFNFSQKFFSYPKLDKILNGVDVFWLPNLNFISLTPNIKRILTVHDLSFLRFPEFFSPKRNFWHQAINIKKLAADFNKIIAVSENTKYDVLDILKVSENKTQTIYSGLDSKYRVLATNDSEIKRVKEKYQLPEKFILYLGTIEPRKNLIALISAYNLLRDEKNELSQFKLLIAGKRGWRTKEIIKAQKKSAYRQDIIFLDYIDNDDKVALYNLAALFVYPSWYEGFGFPPLEAMACGTSVITSDTSSLPEIVGEAGIMVDPYNTSLLSRSMIKVLNNRELADTYRQRGLLQIKSFAWGKAAKEYLECFNSLK